MRHRTLWLCFATLTFAAGSALAGSCILSGDGGLTLQITGTAPVMATPRGAVVQGDITLFPTSNLNAGLNSIYYVDEQPVAMSSMSRPELRVDTAKLSEGIHSVRLEALDGQRLALSSGNLALHVANEATTNVAMTQAGDAAPPFVKLYRKLLLREIIFFNDREADLEKHGFISGGRVYITLTDLMRHIGGTMIWGPTSSYITVSRSGITVRVIPGSSAVYVNGERQSLGRAAIRRDNRTFVPVRPMLDIFGMDTHWNRLLHRAFVNTD